LFAIPFAVFDLFGYIRRVIFRGTVFSILLFFVGAGCKKKQAAAVQESPAPILASNTPKAEAVAVAVPTNSAPVAPLPTNAPVAFKTLPGADLYEKGAALLKGKESAPDPIGAAKLFQQASDLGNPIADHALGVMYLDGYGVEKNIPKAVELLRKSAEQNYPEALFKLASLYARGVAVTPDNKPDMQKAAEFARKAAEQGHIEAEYNLATLYAAGKGVENNVNEAAKWYLKAAEAGHPTAQSNIGVLYANGKAFPQDMNEAIKWWRRAAEQGQATAQYNLGQALQAGKAVPQDKIEAYKWYTLATSGGDRDAEQLKNDLAVEMAPSDIAEALKRASAFTPTAESLKTASNQK
jgi:TPR repeat protein